MITENWKLIFEVDNRGQTPLHWAVKRQQYVIADNLIKNGSDVNHQDFSRKTALYYAIRNKDVYLVQLLLYNGALPWQVYAGPYSKLDFDSPILTQIKMAKQIQIKMQFLCHNESQKIWEEEKHALSLTKNDACLTSFQNTNY